MSRERPPLFFEEQPWGDDAACGDLPASEFNRLFMGENDAERGPASAAITQQAKAVCAACPVKKECADLAVDTGEITLGVRGEKSPRQLQKLRIAYRRRIGDTSRMHSPGADKKGQSKRG